MRGVLYVVARGVFTLSLVFAVSASLSAAPRERDVREKERPVVKIAKKAIRALGDLITIPTPSPTNP